MKPRIDATRPPPGLAGFLADVRVTIDRELTRRLATPPEITEDDPAARLFAAMRHAALAGGKRLRPAIVTDRASGSALLADLPVGSLARCCV